MFNILVDKPPTSVFVDGQEYSINYTAPTLIRMAMLVEELTETDEEAFAQLAQEQLTLFYPRIPINLQSAMEQMIAFYSYTKSTHDIPSIEVDLLDDNSSSVNARKAGFLYGYDSGLIYAAFAQQYPTKDISQMHWFEFRILFEGLSEDTQFAKVMGYRTMKIPSSMSKEDKAFYRRMKRRWALPDKRPQAQKDKDFATSLFYL